MPKLYKEKLQFLTFTAKRDPKRSFENLFLDFVKMKAVFDIVLSWC